MPDRLAVVMAGGRGSRLAPLTDDDPKSMLLIGGRPILARIVERLAGAGVGRIVLAVHYLADRIEAYFGDGAGFGVPISYVREAEPLGTAGALRRLPLRPDRPFLVVNGDIVSDLDFGRMLAAHDAASADLTVAVHDHEVRIPYGVIETDGATLRIVEKPTYRFPVNAGIYVLAPDLPGLLPQGRADMTDLVAAASAAGRRLSAYRIEGEWCDVGQIEDFNRAAARSAS